MQRLHRRRFLMASLVALAVACGGRPVAPPAPQRPAADIAIELVGAQITALIHPDRVAAHPAHARLLHASGLDEVAASLGVDPWRDLTRVFVAARDSRNHHDVVIVAEHRMTEDRARALAGRPVSAGHQRRVVTAPSKGLLVVLPEDMAAKADLFRDAGALPSPTANEAAMLVALDPSRTVAGPGVPPIPPTISRGRAVVTLPPDGTADVALDGDSSAPAQAITDAAALTSVVDAATSRKVLFVKVRLFDAIPFRAEGSQIRAGLHLSAGELDQLMALSR